VRLRNATFADAPAIARLHADSWRRNYRGAYADAYLDGDVIADRLEVWTDRLREPDPHRVTLVAEDDADLIGFAHAVLGDDPTWGALLDNLHVDHGHNRRGIGSRLLARTASIVSPQRTGMYLWVQEQNVAAQHFYRAAGGTRVAREVIPPPGGIAARLNGTPYKLRYAWTDHQLEQLCTEG
jgi:ribosomal protein S18 acetylase RimI-like enzyme